MGAVPGVGTGVTLFRGPTMRQRLLGILAYVVIIAASCESSILSPAPLSDTESGTPAETSATQGSNLLENRTSVSASTPSP
jgi:hypothetical protein